MGHEWLEIIAAVLEAAGIPAGEEFPAGAKGQITAPVAALGIRAMDWAEETVQIGIRIYSPRHLGGWACQEAAVTAASALADSGIFCKGGEISYHSGTNCFCVELTAERKITQNQAVKQSWSIQCNDVIVVGVTEFFTEENRGRRLIGAMGQSGPAGVTPPTGGYTVMLVQLCDGAEQELPEEPFTIIVSDGENRVAYTGCCWNRITRTCTDRGLQVKRIGFALERGEP